MPILARLGAGPMIFPYKSWQDTSDTLNTFKKSWRELRPGTTPPKPVLGSFAYVNKDAGKAKDVAYKYIGGRLGVANTHYINRRTNRGLPKHLRVLHHNTPRCAPW